MVTDRGKKVIAFFYNHAERRYRHIWVIINRRWSNRIHRPLCAAGFYLNLKFFYDDALEAEKDEANKEVLTRLHMCIERMIIDESMIDVLRNELQVYKSVEDHLFSSPQCICVRGLNF